MKKLALLLAALLVITSCRQNVPGDEQETTEEITETTAEETTASEETITTDETTTEEITETTTETNELPAPDFVNDNSRKLYDIIVNNKAVWVKDNTFGGTLLDVDFDGSPEFVVSYGASSIERFTVYQIGDTNGDLTEGVTVKMNADDVRDLCYYFRGWVVPYYYSAETMVNRNGYTVIDFDKPWEYRLSLFDLTGGEPREYVKFCKKFTASGNAETEYEYYADEMRIYPNDEELAKYAEAYAYYETPGSYLPPYPPEDRWYDMKAAFEKELSESAPTNAYKLAPNFHYYPEGENGDYGEWKTWSMFGENELNASLTLLTNAYVTNDAEYLMNPYAYVVCTGCKPVIYLYPTEVTDVSVKVTFPKGGRFTCTYPYYNNGWNVTAYPDGKIINKADGYEYSYLYWEGDGFKELDFSRGFVVKGSETAAFLREKLSYLGLTPREYNEFIVYWLPLMQNNAYNLITFQTQAYENQANLQVTPTPDSILRVFMAYKPLEEYIAVPEQELTQFARCGFSVIEWGGTCVN